MAKSKVKKSTKKPTIQKIPLLHSIMLLTIILIMLACIIICILNSLTSYHVEDVWFYQNITIGGFTFILGFLMGDNVRQKIE